MIGIVSRYAIFRDHTRQHAIAGGMRGIGKAIQPPRFR